MGTRIAEILGNDISSIIRKYLLPPLKKYKPINIENQHYYFTVKKLFKNEFYSISREVIGQIVILYKCNDNDIRINYLKRICPTKHNNLYIIKNIFIIIEIYNLIIYT